MRPRLRGGDGTQEKPYEIATGAQLAYLAKEINSQPPYSDENAYKNTFFVLTADIVLNDISTLSSRSIPWTPIGTYRGDEDPLPIPFYGNFDGQGHTVSGMYADSKTQSGLFGIISGATVSNVIVKDSLVLNNGFYGTAGVVATCLSGSVVKGCTNGATVMGGSGVVCSLNGSTIEDCINLGNITGDNSSAGGVVLGSSDSTIINCVNKGVVTGGAFTGGIIAYGYGRIEKCQNMGDISGTGASGGIVGQYDGEIISCQNSGAVSSSGAFVGGIIGNNQASTTADCKNSGAVTGKSQVGGIAGISRDYRTGNTATISCCSNTGNVSASDTCAGGICGMLDAEVPPRPVSIENCYNTGDISCGDDCLGGIAGIAQAIMYNDTSIKNCYNAGKAQFGIVRSGYGDQCVTCCYYLAEIGSLAMEFGTALTGEQMRKQDSFIGFDFEEVWIMDETTEYPYPELRAYAGPTPEPIHCDVNGDSELNIGDAVMILQYTVDKVTFTEQQELLADMNYDDEINTGDAVSVLKYCVGIEE